MKLRHKLALPIFAASLCFTMPPAHAVSVVLQFSELGVGKATGFSDSAGLVGVNGMRWGVVVDTLQNSLAGAGLAPTQMYDAASFNYSIGGFLTVNNVVTDDYFYPALNQSDGVTPLLTNNQSATGTDPGGPGGISLIGGVPYGGATGITAGDPFAIMWFPTTIAPGNSYGLLQNQVSTPYAIPGSVLADFDIPADGTQVSFASNFFTQSNPLADAIKPANLVLQGVPEPSRLLLLGVGAMGLLLRRRRN